MKTRPTAQAAKFDDTIGDARANLIKTNRGIRQLETYARNIIETTTDSAVIVRTNRMLAELQHMRAATSGIDAALTEATELYAETTPC